jgi:hypothetical protein
MTRHNILVLLFGCGTSALFASSNTHFIPKNTDTLVINQDFVMPKILVDPQTKVIFYLESDGRHISAISPKGKLLWLVDPFADAKLYSYGANFRPLILYFGFAAKPPNNVGKAPWLASDYLEIAYNTSAFGKLIKSDGVFFFGGED